MPVTPSQETTAVARKVAGERALEVRHGAAVVLFGLGPPAGRDPLERRAEAILQDLAPAVRSIRWARQVHGAAVLAAETAAGPSVACVGDADGLASCETGSGLVVWTADCVPVALAGPRAVAMVHAGWRGAAAGIVAAALRRLDQYGVPPGELVAFLGPAVCGRHYPVGTEVIEALARAGVPRAAWLDRDHVELRGFLAAQLEELGVARVGIVGPCTCSTPGLASYRRNGGAAGRQWSLIYRRVSGPDPIE